MTIAVGDRIPDVQVRVPAAGGIDTVSSAELLGKGKVVVFGVPGAFTPTCSDYHLPGFVLRADELEAKGVDTIACVSVNDAFVMRAWGESREVADKVVMVADGGADLTRALGLDAEFPGMGVRSRRYAAIFEDGVLRDLAVEEGGKLEVSGAESVLAKL